MHYKTKGWEKKAEFITQHGPDWETEWAKVTFPFKCACDIPSGNLLDLPTMSDWDKNQIIKGNYINSPNMQASVTNKILNHIRSFMKTKIPRKTQKC